MPGMCKFFTHTGNQYLNTRHANVLMQTPDRLDNYKGSSEGTVQTF